MGQERLEDLRVSPVHRVFPLLQARLAFIQQDNFLRQGNGGAGNLLELRRERSYFLPGCFHACRVLRCGLVCQTASLSNRGAELGSQRRLYLAGHFTDRAGAIDQLVNLAQVSQSCEQRRRLTEQP